MAKEKKLRAKGKGVWAEFKAFISRGNVLDMAVGVVVGGAFGAIVTAVVNVLLSICMWPVPGGLAGLVTVLPAVSEGQIPPEGYKVSYKVAEFLEASEGWTPTQAGMYVQHGGSYYYKGCAIIDWGSIINAVISFIIIALVLFVIIKTVATLKNAREVAKARALEEHYKKHPEDRPVVEAPAAPAPTEAELLTEIRDLLKEKKAK